MVEMLEKMQSELFAGYHNFIVELNENNDNSDTARGIKALYNLMDVALCAAKKTHNVYVATATIEKVKEDMKTFDIMVTSYFKN